MRVGIGRDSYRFEEENTERPLILGGVIFEGERGLLGVMDGDVVLHTLIQAVSGVTCVNLFPEVTEKMCQEAAVADSGELLKEAMKHLRDSQIVHVSITIECQTPPILPRILPMRKSLAKLLGIPVNAVAISAHSGQGLTACGRGEGIQVFCCVTAL